jgi:hypothetical protein
MRTLKTEFSKNGMNYKILGRTEKYYLAEVKSQENPNSKYPYYEVGRIIIFGGRQINGRDIDKSEVLIGNEDFGKDPKGLEGFYNMANKQKAFDMFEQSKTT